MVEFREDALAYPLMIKLAGCLEAELAASGLPLLCSVAVQPGAMVALDACEGGCGSGKCGQAYVRLMSIWASTSFPQPDATPRLNARLAYDLEVGVMRCAPGPDNRGNPPEMAALVESTRLQLADAAAMRRALACCIGTDDQDYILGIYAPYGPQGGCVGGTWTIALAQAD